MRAVAARVERTGDRLARHVRRGEHHRHEYSGIIQGAVVEREFAARPTTFDPFRQLGARRFITARPDCGCEFGRQAPFCADQLQEDPAAQVVGLGHVGAEDFCERGVYEVVVGDRVKIQHQFAMPIRQGLEKGRFGGKQAVERLLRPMPPRGEFIHGGGDVAMFDKNLQRQIENGVAPVLT